MANTDQVVAGKRVTEGNSAAAPSTCGYFLLVLREHTVRGTLCTHIDARLKGNAARFANHSCDPNMLVHAVRCGSLVPRLAFVAARNIAAMEPLCFDYGENR